MSVREKLEIPSPPPDWIVTASETTILLYNSAESEYRRIKNLISCSGILSTRDQKINLSAVSRAAGRDKSLLSSRRQPELVAWISERNLELQMLLAKKSSPKQKKISSNKLRAENTELRAKHTQAITEGLRTFVQEILDSDLLHDRDKLAADNIRLRRENQKLREVIDNLRALCESQSKERGKLSRGKFRTALELVPSTPKD
jgi:hypothetical protein